MEPKPQRALAQEIERAEILTGIRNTLDLTYRRARQAARADWERLFNGDPADTCVTVRVQTGPATATRGAGFLKLRRELVSKSRVKGSVPHFAH